MRLSLSTIFLFVTFSSLFGQSKIYQAPRSSWIEEYNFTSDISDTVQYSNGYAYLLISLQSNLEEKEYYSKYVMKVTSEQGLSFVSNINESFDPAFQKLTFHELNIIRNA